MRTHLTSNSCCKEHNLMSTCAVNLNVAYSPAICQSPSFMYEYRLFCLTAVFESFPLYVLPFCVKWRTLVSLHCTLIIRYFVAKFEVKLFSADRCCELAFELKAWLREDVIIAFPWRKSDKKQYFFKYSFLNSWDLQATTCQIPK